MKHHSKHGHHPMHHKEHHMQGHSGHHAMYRNEVDEPHEPAQGHMMHGMGMEDFKGEADPIAYGQAAGPGMKSDMSKIHGQFKDYHWD